MSITTAILLLISAFTHAGWNFISKKDHPTTAYFLIANTVGVFCVLPLLVYYRNQIALIPGTVWLFVAMSGFFLAAYMAALAGAYRKGDMSIAYPLARSLPVIFVLIFTILWSDAPSLGAWVILGIFLVVAGCTVLPMKSFQQFQWINYRNLCCFLAVLSAIWVAGYTVTDDAALRHLRQLPGKPLSPIDGTLIYITLEGISCSLWLVAIVLFSAVERKSFCEILRRHKGSAATTGVGIFLTYGLVLASMNYVANISYVAAFRQLSILIGAGLGMAILKEPPYIPKIMGTFLIFIGLVLVGIG